MSEADEALLAKIEALSATIQACIEKKNEPYEHMEELNRTLDSYHKEVANALLSMPDEKADRFIETVFGGVARKVLAELVIMKEQVSNLFHFNGFILVLGSDLWVLQKPGRALLCAADREA